MSENIKKITKAFKVDLDSRENQSIILKSSACPFKPLKQKSQISLVFGMNALVPLGTIKTL